MIAIGVSFPVGLLFGYKLRKAIAEKKIKSAEEQADFIILEAKKQAETTKKGMLIEAKEEVHGMRIDLEKETRERRNELQKIERRNLQKEESLDNKQEQFEIREKTITNKEKELNRLEVHVNSLHEKQLQELEKIASLTVEEAKEKLLSDVDKNLTHEKVIMIKNMESEAKLKADKKSKEILAYAIQKCAADYVAETTVSVVTLPNEEMKGRIIGREGRNIRAIETITGVDLIIDDTPEAVILSSFDPVRREIAKTALEKLIVDGRIHPARIEEMVEKAKQEMDEQLKEEGENATFDLGIHNIHPELIKLIGRLKYRTSYGQNVLKHSLEVAYLAGTMAAELGLDVRIAKRAGLLHDIGKAVDHEMEGTHVEIGMNLLKKYKESKWVIHAMSTHHGDYEPETIEAILVTAADAISAARPGARRETLDNYVKRLEALENITNSYESVEKSYAIQAGREVRIMVIPEKINDDEIVLLAREISKRIEDELEYPGQVKVHIIRETRAIEYAK
ncbi:MAG: ribonuclease Y [Clostridiales bacterium]|nr:ribonuclease Y [Clostridiales bacterium]